MVDRWVEIGDGVVGFVGVVRLGCDLGQWFSWVWKLEVKWVCGVWVFGFGSLIFWGIWVVVGLALCL